MKWFGKHVSKKDKKALFTQLFAVVLSGILAITLGVISFAWFSMNSSVDHSGMQVVVSSDAVDILIERSSSEYDVGYEGITGAGGLKSVLAAKEYDFVATDSADAYLLAYELVVTDITYEGKRYLVPGAYGTMTFYIRPQTGHDNETVRIGLSFDGYANVYSEGASTPTIQLVTKESVCNLLKGHILFFQNYDYDSTYDGYVYSNMITDGGFDYDMSQHSKCTDPGKTDLYKIELYWEWPITYYAIHDDLSTTSPAVTNKYPVETGVLMEQNPNYFYPPYATLTTDENKSDAYNDGDQLIGDNVEFLVVRIGVM